MNYDNTNIINRTFDFSPLYREATILIPLKGLTSFKEVEFTFYTRPSYLLSGSVQNFGGAEDLNFYINGFNLTAGLKKILITRLKKLSVEKLSEQYLFGAKTYCDYINSFDFLDEQYKNEYQVAKSYISNIDISSAFEKIGNRKIGIGGNLHLVNFLFRYIDIEPISFSEIIAESGINSKEVYKNNNIIIQISQGISPTLNAFDPTKFIPTGSIELNLFVKTENPLEKPIKDIFSRLTLLQKQLEMQRTNYLNPLSDITNKVENDLNFASDRILKELSQITENINEIK
ncbi:MAG: hypothetical protein KBC56_02680 [Flavobacterium sp.]|nr:hypothetical protein [Flavobacterium sp.]